MEAVANLAFKFPLVVDPVMISKHGARLIERDDAAGRWSIICFHAHIF